MVAVAKRLFLLAEAVDSNPVRSYPVVGPPNGVHAAFSTECWSVDGVAAGVCAPGRVSVSAGTAAAAYAAWGKTKP